MKQEIYATFILSPYDCFSVEIKHGVFHKWNDEKQKHEKVIEDVEFTSAIEVFNRPKSDYNRCGQGQDSVLPKYKKAFEFYKKWDNMHLKKLNDSQYEEVIKDLVLLSKVYKCHVIQNTDIGFHQQKELSKQFRKCNK